MPKQKLRRYDVITIFPGMIPGYVSESILGRAQGQKLISIAAHDLRQWAPDKHRSVDDSPYGGGPGMVMKVDVWDRAMKAVRGRKVGKAGKGTRVILTSASGKTFTQQDAVRLAKYERVIFICGRYEGIDARVEEHIADEAFSIGNYVLTGGELPALVMIDAIARNVPGVLGTQESLAEESHTEEGVLEYPQYTKPAIYKKWKVPEVLLSGDHKKIAQWRREQSETRG